MGSEPDKVVFQEKFHYVHIGQNLRWIFDALPLQTPIDISRAATLSPDLQNDLQNLKPSRLFSENRLVFIFMNNFFFYILEWTGGTGSLHAYKCKYICTEVHANLIAQSRTIYLVAMSFGENMWGETSSIFLLITTTLVWKENISWSVSVKNLLYKNLLLGCHYTYLFQHSLVHLLIRANGYKLEKLKH